MGNCSDFVGKTSDTAVNNGRELPKNAAGMSPAQFNVCFRGGTERPFSGAYWNEHASGRYLCAGCDSLLFESSSKFDSGTGWPSFWEPVSGQAVERVEDRSLGMARVEVRCKQCGCH